MASSLSTTTKNLTGLFARLSMRTATPLTAAARPTRTQAVLPTAAAQRCLSTTPAPQAGGGKKASSSKKGKKGKKGAVEKDQRILNLRASMPRVVPSPLRFGRNRYLRHWTIHRAWLLFQRQQREAKEKELGRMYQSMHNACEELRKTSGPGLRDEGYLYRVAMGKQGIFGKSSIPIEYARLQTETPAREPWNHEWKR